MTTDSPIFIVGLPRSGTTLLSAMLGAHSRLDCGPETHFFTYLNRADLRQILDPRRWPSAGVAFLGSIVLDGQPVHQSFGVSLADIEAVLRQRAPAIPALLEALTGVRAVRSGKPRWIEKTPNHLLHLQRIRSVYPGARIIRIVRDPRDVALSLKRVPFASNSTIANLYSCVDRDERSWRFFEDDPGCIGVRYEDLVTNPVYELTRLCAFVSEPFEEQMLTPHHSAEAVISSGEWWKENVRRPISGGRVEAWRHELSDDEQAVAALVCAEALERYGYPGAFMAGTTLTCQPLSAEFIERNEALLVELATSGIRLMPWDSRRDLPDVAWGLARQLRWSLGKTSGARVASAIGIATRIATSRMRGRQITWIAEDTSLEAGRGFVDRVCDLAIRATARRQQRRALIDDVSGRIVTSKRSPEVESSSTAR